MEEEQLSEPLPPTAEAVAARSIILSVVSCRGIIDEDARAVDLAKRSCDWLRAIDLFERANDWERSILTSPFGTLSERDRINASWLSEAVAILAWTLGKMELPSLEQQCDPSTVANSLGFLQPTADTVLRHPELRPSNELLDYNEFIYNVHWRIRGFSLNRHSYDFESLATKAWGHPILRHGLMIQERDLCVGGIPISRAGEREWRKLASITQERHRASNWLIGYASEDFYEVTTDT